MSASRRATADPRVLERYLRSQLLPRFVVRLREIEDQTVEHRMRLARRREEIARATGRDPARFEERWRATVAKWDFARVNELIDQHNAYYPIERNLPVDPRTGRYATVNGRPYEREPLGPKWILEQFPAAEPFPPAEPPPAAA